MSTVMTETKLLVAKVFGKKNIQFLELGNPFLIQINNNKYYIYIKNITSAYFKSRPDITRIQLGYSAKLNKICKSNIPFLLLGLDPINDVFACWDPTKIKRRLNAKANISLYSKNSVQKSISGNKIILHELANGDKVVLFKTKTVSDFLEKLENYFPNAFVYNPKRVSKIVKDPKVLSYGEDLFTQIDSSLKKRVRVFIKENKILDAVALCIEHYGDKHKNMSFSQWHEFVKKL
jgi:hypothetical protein